MDETKLTTVTSRPTTLVLGSLLKAMRPKQWVKNVFVFAGIVFAREHLLLQPAEIGRTMTAFALFCLTSSSVYLINDVIDKERDRQHPEKRFRPIASGELPVWIALVCAVVFPLFSIGYALVRGLATTPVDTGWLAFGAILSIYFLLQIAYSVRLKHIVLVDLFVITAGFLLRAVGGAAVISVDITPWWLLCVFFLALFLGLGKRRHELSLLANQAAAHRRTLQDYSIQLIDQLLTIDLACTIIVYSQATFTTPLASSMPYPFLMLTIPLVVFALFRYLYLVVQKSEGGEPADIILRDRPLEVVIAMCGFMVLFIQSLRF